MPNRNKRLLGNNETNMKTLEQATSRELEIELLQRAIQKRAVAIEAFEVGIKVLKVKQARGFAELSKQTAASARCSNAEVSGGASVMATLQPKEAK